MAIWRHVLTDITHFAPYPVAQEVTLIICSAIPAPCPDVLLRLRTVQPPQDILAAIWGIVALLDCASMEHDRRTIRHLNTHGSPCHPSPLAMASASSSPLSFKWVNDEYKTKETATIPRAPPHDVALFLTPPRRCQQLAQIQYRLAAKLHTQQHTNKEKKTSTHKKLNVVLVKQNKPKAS